MTESHQRRRHILTRPVALTLGGGLTAIALLCLCALVLTSVDNAGGLGLASCPSALPPLHLSGARQLSVPAPCSIDWRTRCPGVIDTILPYATGERTARPDNVLFSQDGRYYTVGEGAAHALSMPDACIGPVAVTPDGQGLACVAHARGCVDCFTACTACFGDSIVLVSLTHATSGRSQTLVEAQPDILFGILSWSPDGRHLAVVRREVVGGSAECTLALYTASVSAAPLVLTGLLSVSDLSLCNMGQISWSPDGQRLALSQVYGNETWGIFILPVSIWPAAALSIGAQPAHASAALLPFRLLVTPKLDSDPFHTRSYIAWVPRSAVLTVSTAFGSRVLLIDTATRQQRLLFALAPGSSPIQNFNWMPDGRHLVFAIGHGVTDTCAAPPQALYSESFSSPVTELFSVTPIATRIP